MELDVRLKFPTEKVEVVLEWLRSLPYGAVELQPRTAEAADAAKAAEREQKFYALFGAWKEEGETGDDFNHMLQEARYTEHRDIEL